jgi:hypothetical protein
VTPEEVAMACDELHECVDTGPGGDGSGFARALSVLRRLRSAASWDYPLGIVRDIEVRLARWFSADQWQGEDQGRTSRQDLLERISRLEDAWERPRT